MHTAIKELEDEIENPGSILNRTGAGKKSELGILVKNCNGVLQQLNKKLIKYKSLGSATRRTWDRLKWSAENLQEIREKLLAHTSSLTLFLTTLGTGSLGRIEKKLDQLIEDVRAGRREESVLTFAVGEDDPDESEIQWGVLKGELVEDGFAKSEIEAHKHWIMAKLAELIENGGLEEQFPPERIGASKEKKVSPRPPSHAEKEVVVSDTLLRERCRSLNTTDVPKKLTAFQPTVEDADEDDEGIIQNIRMVNAKRMQASQVTTKGAREFDETEEDTSPEAEVSHEEAIHEKPARFTTEAAIYEKATSTDRVAEELMRRKRDKDTWRAAHGTTKQSRDEVRKPTEVEQQSHEAYTEEDASDETDDTSLGTVLPTDSVSLVGDITAPQSNPFERVRYIEPRSAKYRVDTAKVYPQQQPPSSNEDIAPQEPVRHSKKSAGYESAGRQNRTSAGKTTLAELATTGLGALALNSSRSRSLERDYRQQRGSPDSYDSRSRSTNGRRSGSPDSYDSRSRSPKRHHKGNKSVTDYARKGLAALGIGETAGYADGYSRRRSKVNNEYTRNGIAALGVSDEVGDHRDERFGSSPPRRRERHTTHQPREAKGFDNGRPQYYNPDGSRVSVTPFARAQTFTSPLPLAETIHSPYVEINRPESQGPGPNFNTSNQGAGGGFDFSNPEKIFSECLRGQQTQSGAGGGFDFSNPEKVFSAFLRGQQKLSGAREFDDISQVTTVKRPLALSLEELFNGCHKKMKIKRKAFDEVTGHMVTQDKLLEMDLKPGLQKGTKVKYKGVGDAVEGGRQDLHFIIEEVSKITSILQPSNFPAEYY